MSTPPSRPQIGGSAGKAVSTPNRLPSKKHYKNTVVLSVGPSKQEFTVHKELLCFYSDFFRAAFNGSFKEATEGRIELPDAQLDVFEIFQVWLYSRSLLNTEDLQDQPDYQKYPSFSTLARLWVFGDKYQIPLLQNCAADAILQYTKDKNRFCTNVLKTAYDHTMEGSPLRRLAIDILVFRMVHEEAANSILREGLLYTWSKESLVDFARGISKAWMLGLPHRKFPEQGKCHYHIHAEGEHC
ncbi:hypothetical protein D6D13_08371 [Aureobasidium pullulans]|uniref:BTB domain-containing protein n=1 Tax=Aureobasidium pullulans TaxID=5580 RepID=A0A4S9C8J2_AURPU|nr:hypothetical protein D6D13_08371 [Aureobasidium pullulans]